MFQPLSDHGSSCCLFVVYRSALLSLPETNIASQNRPLEKEKPIGNHHFSGLCWFQGGYITAPVNPATVQAGWWTTAIPWAAFGMAGCPSVSDR